jgi:hypothetical protein
MYNNNSNPDCFNNIRTGIAVGFIKSAGIISDSRKKAGAILRLIFL